MARPAIAPVANPTSVTLPMVIRSIAAQASEPVTAAICVTVKALAASWFAPSADPALKPNDPNQQDSGPQHDQRDRMGQARVRRAVLVRGPTMRTTTTAEKPALCVDDGAAGEVPATEFVDPSGGVEDPMSNDRIDDQAPTDAEGDPGLKIHPACNGSGDQPGVMMANINWNPM